MTCKKSSDISPSMCIMPWIGMATDASGGIRPCCWMQAISDDKFFGSPNDYQESEYLKEIKTKFLKGEYPESCSRCQHDDLKGLQSKRYRENKTWEVNGGDWNDIDKKGFSMIDLRLSNVCNLGCVMCGPKSSSFLYKETENHLDIAPDHNVSQFRLVKDTDLLNPYSDNDIEEIIDLIGPDARVYCTGGEPSLVKKTTRLLEVLLKKGYNKTVTLQFSSNFQVLNQQWFDLLKHFKGDMLPSIDGVGRTAEYVRYPCNWSQVDNNIRSFIDQCGETWTVKIMPTVSIASIFGLKDLYDWWYNDIRNNFPIVAEAIRTKNSDKAMRVQVNNRLVKPEWFDIRNLPDKAKKQATADIDFIIETYGQYFQGPGEKRYLDDIKGHLKLDPIKDFDKCVSNLNKFDIIRKQDWKTSLNELFEYTKGFKVAE
jgi:sulfatase maturation enzyme AslB (radical SAM superfamily)